MENIAETIKEDYNLKMICVQLVYMMVKESISGMQEKGDGDEIEKIEQFMATLNTLQETEKYNIKDLALKMVEQIKQ